MEEQTLRSIEGAQFGCSQTSVDERDPQWLNSLDINIPSITISAYNKNLFVDAPLTIAHGRHYGLGCSKKMPLFLLYLCSLY